MRRTPSLRAVAVVVAGLATASPGLAQSELKDNGEHTGRLARARQRDTWSFELEQKTKTINVHVACDTTRVVVFIQKVGDGTRYVLLPDTGTRSHSSGVAGNVVSAHPDPDRHPALDKGRYVIAVEAANGQGTGDYTIRIAELKAVERKAAEPKAPESAADRLARLRRELAAVRAREAELVEQINRLEADSKR